MGQAQAITGRILIPRYDNSVCEQGIQSLEAGYGQASGSLNRFGSYILSTWHCQPAIRLTVSRRYFSTQCDQRPL
jgi:hypothetical protein